MPQGKKKARNTNKKKKNRGNVGGTSRAHQQQTQPPPPRPAAPTPRLNPNDFPSWDDFGGKKKASVKLKSVVQLYKEATTRFKNGLQRLVPPDILVDSVKSLIDAADYISDNQIPIERHLIRDLKLALRVRMRVAKAYFGAGRGDEGHSHFIAVLAHCWVVLRPLVQTAAMKPPQQEEPTVDTAAANQFEALHIDDEDDDEEDLPTEPVKLPPDDELARLSLRELMQGTDRMAAIIFLASMDEMMSFTVLQYSTLKQGWRDVRVNNRPEPVIIEQLMEAAVATNMAIQQVASMEEQFINEYPHMNTCYRLLSVLILPDLTRHLTEIVTTKSPIASEFTEKDASMYLGDLLECGFRNVSDPRNQGDELAASFASKWRLQTSDVNEFVQQVKMVAMAECPLKQEVGMNSSLLQIASSCGMRKHSWLPNCEAIGKERSILSTIRLLQSMSNILRDRKGYLVVQPGFFGRQWEDSGRGLAKSIHTDLDECLMADILPVLVDSCWEGLLSSNLPFEAELLPFFVQLKSFVKRPEGPISWSLAFAIHCMLTSIFEVQGSNDVHDIGQTAKQCFEHYFSQISWVMQTTENTRQGQHFHANLKRLGTLGYLVHPPRVRPTDKQLLRAMWNPLCAGTFFSYLVTFSNLEGGTGMIDSYAQLRIVLHLFNAFVQVGAIQKGEVELLDWLSDQFQDSKAVWEGTDRPKKGEFVQRWWIAYGTKIAEAKRKSEETKLKVVSNNYTASSDRTESRRNQQDLTRPMTPIEAKDLSKSFRRICLRDFSGVEDKYHSTEQKTYWRGKDSAKWQDVYECAVRANDTLDAIESEQRLLASNLTSLGAILNQFVESLFRVLKWDTIVEKIVLETPYSVKRGTRVDGRRVSANSWEASDDNLSRFAMVQIFAEQLLGRLDYTDFPQNTLGNDECISACEFLKIFFNGVSPEKVMFFIPVEEEE